MSFLEMGETAVIDDGQEFVCYGNVNFEGKNYAFLVNQKDQKEKLVVEQKQDGNELELEIIEDESLKKQLLDMLVQKSKKFFE